MFHHSWRNPCSIFITTLSNATDIQPVIIISAYNKAPKEALETIKQMSVPNNIINDEEVLALIKMSIVTNFVPRWSDLMCNLALQAVRTVAQDHNWMKTGHKAICWDRKGSWRRGQAEQSLARCHG
jgi:hypothetical protein